MDNDYTVKTSQWGIAVFGDIPVNDIVGLTTTWKKRGFKLLSPALAGVLNAAIVVVKSQKDEDNWRRELGATPDNPDWLMSGDTGTSSLTIYQFFTGHQVVDRPDIPHDPDDFGRCYRLLKRFPEWRPRLGDLATKYPAWKPLVREWARMTELFEKESPSGNCPELYVLMLACRSEVQHAAV